MILWVKEYETYDIFGYWGPAQISLKGSGYII